MTFGLNKQVTEATAKATGRRWCSHHMGEHPVDDGNMVERRKSKRWVCFPCQRRAGLLKDAN